MGKLLDENSLLGIKDYVDTGLSGKANVSDLSTYAKRLDVSMNPSTYVITFTLKDASGTTLNSQTVDLPLESTVVNGSYNNNTKSIVLTLTSGSTITIPVSDLINGLVNESDLTNTLKNYVKFVKDVAVQSQTLGDLSQSTGTFGTGPVFYTIGNNSYLVKLTPGSTNIHFVIVSLTTGEIWSASVSTSTTWSQALVNANLVIGAPLTRQQTLDILNGN